MRGTDRTRAAPPAPGRQIVREDQARRPPITHAAELVLVRQLVDHMLKVGTVPGLESGGVAYYGKALNDLRPYGNANSANMQADSSNANIVDASATLEVSGTCLGRSLADCTIL